MLGVVRAAIIRISVLVRGRSCTTTEYNFGVFRCEISGCYASVCDCLPTRLCLTRSRGTKNQKKSINQSVKSHRRVPHTRPHIWLILIFILRPHDAVLLRLFCCCLCSLVRPLAWWIPNRSIFNFAFGIASNLFVCVFVCVLWFHIK